MTTPAARTTTISGESGPARRPASSRARGPERHDRRTGWGRDPDRLGPPRPILPEVRPLRLHLPQRPLADPGRARRRFGPRLARPDLDHETRDRRTGRVRQRGGRDGKDRARGARFRRLRFHRLPHRPAELRGVPVRHAGRRAARPTDLQEHRRLRCALGPPRIRPRADPRGHRGTLQAPRGRSAREEPQGARDRAQGGARGPRSRPGGSPSSTGTRTTRSSPPGTRPWRSDSSSAGDDSSPVTRSRRRPR